MSSTTYLVTGPNRGLGKGFVTQLLSRPNTTVIAGVRDPTAPASKDLSNLPVATGSKLIVIKLDSTSRTDPEAARDVLESQYGISKLDVFIANAGILQRFGPALETPAQDLEETFAVNTVAPLVQLQGLWPLLQKSSAPKFFVVSTNMASFAMVEQIPFQAVSYSVSKVAVTFIVRKLHFENQDLITGALNPGFVQTDMGWFAAHAHGLKEIPVTIEQSVSGMLTQVDETTKEKNSGGFINFDGAIIPW